VASRSLHFFINFLIFKIEIMFPAMLTKLATRANHINHSSISVVGAIIGRAAPPAHGATGRGIETAGTWGH
jgi:hypothetical protein